MRHLVGYAAAFLGAGLGGTLRYGVNILGVWWLGAAFPYSTLFINITGSLAMGLLTSWFALRGAGSSAAFRVFLLTGVLGGYTTFSTFSLDAALLWSRGRFLVAAAYVIASVAFSLAGVGAGLALLRIGR